MRWDVRGCWCGGARTTKDTVFDYERSFVNWWWRYYEEECLVSGVNIIIMTHLQNLWVFSDLHVCFEVCGYTGRIGECQRRALYCFFLIFERQENWQDWGGLCEEWSLHVGIAIVNLVRTICISMILVSSGLTLYASFFLNGDILLIHISCFLWLQLLYEYLKPLNGL